MFIVADSNAIDGKARLGDRKRKVSDNGASAFWCASQREHAEGYFDVRLETESVCAGVADVVAERLDRVEALGNGQVPAVVRLAWETLTGRSLR
jgi:hypothetical protein